jgi:hypothetical protein
MARSRNNPRKIASIQPVGAGRMKAQQPAASANLQKASTLSRDLETVKQMARPQAVHIVFGDTPYSIGPDVYLTVVNTVDGAIEVFLPKTATNHMRTLIVQKNTISANTVLLRVEPGSNNVIRSAITGGATTKSFTGSDFPYMMLLADDVTSNWWVISEGGTIV